MVCCAQLVSFHILEREIQRNFIIWSFPTLPEEVAHFLRIQTFIGGPFSCFRKGHFWLYIQNINDEKAIVVLSKEFHPNKYKAFCSILTKKYAQLQNPVELVKLYLNAFITGVCSIKENGTLFACDLKQFKDNSGIKNFIQIYNVEVIIFYTVILLKRRLLVYHSNITNILQDLFAIVNLVPNRNFNEYLHPIISSAKELKGLPFYVSGTTNKSLMDDESVFDVFVNLETQEILVASHAKKSLAMTKTHKDIAIFLVKLAESNLDEIEIKIRILEKTNDILRLLKSLASVTTENNVKMIAMNDLKAKNYNQNLENFLFNLAIAENIMML